MSGPALKSRPTLEHRYVSCYSQSTSAAKTYFQNMGYPIPSPLPFLSPFSISFALPTFNPANNSYHDLPFTFPLKPSPVTLLEGMSEHSFSSGG